MLTTCRHDEPNLLALLDCPKLSRLIQDPPTENITVTTIDGHPHRLWRSVGDAWSPVMHDNLKVVRVFRMETPFEFRMSAPLHASWSR